MTKLERNTFFYKNSPQSEFDIIISLIYKQKNLDEIV